MIRVNLAVMAYMWAACSFCFYMIIFYLKYLPGNIYNNSLSSGVADCIAVLIGGWLYSRIGIKKSFSLLFTISTIGGFIIIFLGDSATLLMPLFVVICKFGITGGFVIVYCSTVDMFPTLFCSTALGFCNFGARILSIAAPIIAESEPPLPMIILTALSACGVILI